MTEPSEAAAGGPAPEGTEIDVPAVMRFMKDWFGRKWGMSVQDREDLVAEATASVWISTRTTRPDRLEAFLNTIAYRTFVDWCRRKQTRQKLFVTEAPMADPPAPPVLDPDVGDAFERRLFTMTSWFEQNQPACRPIAVEHVGRGRTLKDLAEEWNLSHDQLRQRWQRCRERFRKAVDAHRAAHDGDEPEGAL